MRKNLYRENEIIEQTRQVIQSFYGRKTESTIAPMSEDFMWIGSNDFQWCEGIDEFIQVTKKEYQEEPVLLSDEEYHLLFHERNVWVVYGRYKVTATLKDLSRIRLHIRVTFIWRMIKGNLRLAHVHGSASQDIPLEPFLQTESTFTEESDFFDFMEKLASAERNLQKLTIRDCEKNHRCLFPSEILYLKAAGRHCIFQKPVAFRLRAFYPPMNKKCRNRSFGSTKVIWLTVCILIVSPAIMQCLRAAANFRSVKSAT